MSLRELIDKAKSGIVRVPAGILLEAIRAHPDPGDAWNKCAEHLSKSHPTLPTFSEKAHLEKLLEGVEGKPEQKGEADANIPKQVARKRRGSKDVESPPDIPSGGSSEGEAGA